MRLVQNFESVLSRFERRRCDTRLIEALSHMPGLQASVLTDRDEAERLLDSLRESLEEQQEGVIEDTEVEWDEVHNGYRLVLTTHFQDAIFGTEIGRALLTSAELRELRRLRQQLVELGEPPYILINGEAESVIGSRSELLQTVSAIGRKDLSIQRYKGLGEMNPSQLWETTMDPEQRTLLQVALEDAVEADNVFTVLMGDQVEPRKAFIEAHAREVVNLDV